MLIQTSTLPIFLRYTDILLTEMLLNPWSIDECTLKSSDG